MEKKPGRSKDFFSSAKEIEKEMKIQMGKNLDIFKFFLWWKLSRWKKKPGRSKDFFPLQKKWKKK